jgi:hypothetical protein
MTTGALKSFQYIAPVCISISIIQRADPVRSKRALVSEDEVNIMAMGSSSKRLLIEKSAAQAVNLYQPLVKPSFAELASAVSPLHA